ncbi:hypothetical protein BC940DRAFT_328453 [Gongronella butleri]|nr:hypothetical protein BC940DRAFT_328453 [Gongronella butleri]
MGKKQANSKAEAAKEKKAAVKNDKDRAKAAQKEAGEAAKWEQGAKKTNKKDMEADKKASNPETTSPPSPARLLAEEESSLPSKVKGSGSDKKAAKKTAKVEQAGAARRTIPEFSASNIDDALDLLSLNDTAKAGAKDVERHPERRFKAAYAAYKEREIPILKKENPGLRLTQLEEIAYKNFKKSPENPFNQANVLTYNATQDDAQQLKDTKRKEIEQRLGA